MKPIKTLPDYIKRIQALADPNRSFQLLYRGQNKNSIAGKEPWDPQDVLAVGQNVTARVIRIDHLEWRIALSLKAAK